eukprot:CAMPEP_0114544720 /NCGR_PEP_ID=MMETSP0114-20121206/3023_1 /TAXON_ID=31324 /ORGANISM="Goniomonas sp, Strain m" /LENGTH=394 /DNA_ID=CAMNT_0001729111 /DNA_START=379 /DNA_END=1563 /DNA_ORIENTATION=-
MIWDSSQPPTPQGGFTPASMTNTPIPSPMHNKNAFTFDAVPHMSPSPMTPTPNLPVGNGFSSHPIPQVNSPPFAVTPLVPVATQPMSAPLVSAPLVSAPLVSAPLGSAPPVAAATASAATPDDHPIENLVLKVTEETSENAPLNAEEQEIMTAMISKIGQARAEQVSLETRTRYVRAYAFEGRRHGKERWLEVSTREFDRTLNWRAEVGADTLAKRTIPKADLFKTAWKTCLAGTDRQGHPIMVERMCDIDVDALLGNFSGEELGLLQAQKLERLNRVKLQISAQLQRSVYKHCYIFDLGGLALRHLKVKDQLKAIFHVAEFYYPETLWKMFLINTPMAFRAVWGVVQPLIHEKTRVKIKVLSRNYLSELEAHGVDVDQIPPSVGGTYARNYLQ